MEWFSLLIGIGASLGLLQITRKAPNGKELRWSLAGLGVLLCALIGARLNYILLHPSYYHINPASAFYIWEGGLSWPGALLFALAALPVCAWLLRFPLAGAADIFIPLFPITAVMIWVGCAQAGIGYGASVDANVQFSLQVTHQNMPPTYHWPLQYAAALSLLAIIWGGERSFLDIDMPGNYAAQTGLLLGLHTLLFSWLRNDLVPIWNEIRLDYMAAGLLLVIATFSLIIIGISRLRSQFSTEASDSNQSNKKSTP